MHDIIIYSSSTIIGSASAIKWYLMSKKNIENANDQEAEYFSFTSSAIVGFAAFTVSGSIIEFFLRTL